MRRRRSSGARRCGFQASSEERTELLLSWRHTGFSVHNSVRVEPEDGAAVERLSRYIMRPPISLERMEWDGVGEVRYRGTTGHDGGVLIIYRGVDLDQRNLVIMAVAVGLGLGVELRPDALVALPQGLRTFFGSGLITGGLTALVLNVVLPGRLRNSD